MNDTVSNQSGDEPTPALEVLGVSKLFPVFKRPFEGFKYLYQVVRGRTDYVKQIDHVRALSEVTFTIRTGERVGLIGRNGSGKTTLLNLIASGLSSTEGSVRASGPVYCLSATNLGFDPELSARRNTVAFLDLYNVPEGVVAERVREIEEFLELGPYFDQPFKFCSLGMRARAEFAAATAVDASVILIDEVLGAGDVYWAERCAQRLEGFCADGRSLLLVSHSMDQILRYCDRVIWIDCGRIVMDGRSGEVVRRYEAYLEHLVWSGDDIEDKIFNWQTHKGSYSDVVLEDSGTPVMRWPGQQRLVFNGIWINGSADTVQCVGRAEPLRIRFTVKANEAGSYVLRYILSFWAPSGKRLGIAENERDSITIAKDGTHEVSFEIPGGIIGRGTYDLSLTMSDLRLSGSSSNEQSSRQDVIYKSIHLTVSDTEKSESVDDFGTFFSLPLSMHCLPADAAATMADDRLR